MASPAACALPRRLAGAAVCLRPRAALVHGLLAPAGARPAATATTATTVAPVRVSRYHPSPPRAPPAGPTPLPALMGVLRPIEHYSLPADLHRAKVDGVWRKPRLGGVERSRLRKRALMAAIASGEPCAWRVDEWDAQRAARVSKPPKGHKRAHRMAERCVWVEGGASPSLSLAARDGRVVLLRALRGPWPSASTLLPSPPSTVRPLCRRLDKINAALGPAQEKRRADYAKTLPSRPPREGLLQWVKKNAWEKE
jgi:hypothetical protein